MSRYLLGPRCLLWMANQEPATLEWFSTIRPLDCIVSDLSMAIAKAAVAEMEWKETEHKARALMRAAELVEEGLE